MQNRSICKNKEQNCHKKIIFELLLKLKKKKRKKIVELHVLLKLGTVLLTYYKLNPKQYQKTVSWTVRYTVRPNKDRQYCLYIWT